MREKEKDSEKYENFSMNFNATTVKKASSPLKRCCNAITTLGDNVDCYDDDDDIVKDAISTLGDNVDCYDDDDNIV